MVFELICLLFPLFSPGNVYINAHQGQKIVDTWIIDSWLNVQDSVSGKDTLPDEVQEGTFNLLVSKDALDAPVQYHASDSIVYDIGGEKIYLFGKAQVVYNEIKLIASKIEFDWRNNTVTAFALADSLGHLIEKAIFTEGSTSFRSRKLMYNFETKKGKIFDLVTEEGDGFIHTVEAKKNEQDHLFARKARYTTCDADHPHFYIEANPLKIIPDELLVCGPTNLVIQGVRTPLVLPFAVFPIKGGQRSGIVFPEYGESSNLGFSLTNGGYYFGISDHFDLQLTGDIYTSGSWRLNMSSNYAKRYRYRGNFAVEFGKLRFGDELLNELNIQKTFKVGWNFRLDPKAWPNNNFSANVSVASNNFNQYNSFDLENHINNSYNSSINYSRSWPGKPFSLNASLRHSQNTQTKQVTLTLPEVAFSVSRINPFKRKIQSGEKKWYEKLGFSYSMNTKNFLNITDSLLFEPGVLEKFRFGVQHNIPLNASFKLFKYFTLTPGFNYTENWFLEGYDKRYEPVSIGDTAVQYVHTDTFRKFNSARYFNTNLSLNTRIYGRLNFRKGWVRAIRHVATPSLSFNYRPDFGAESWGYYKTVQTDPDGNTETYSTLPSDLYGLPPKGRVGGIGFSVNNSIEMKVLSPKDTVNQLKKVRLIESADISTFYNFALDSLNLQRIRISARTTLFEKVSVNFSGTFDPYILNVAGTANLNKFEWAENKRLARMEDLTLNLGTSFKSKPRSRVHEPGWAGPVYPGEQVVYPDFELPWDVSASYSLRLDKGFAGVEDSINITQSLRVDLRFSLTSKWQFNVGTGYDFVSKEFVYTTVDVYRDLHCWEMRFRWIPFGFLKSYTFGINVKSSVLKDLKIEKKSNPYDNF